MSQDMLRNARAEALFASNLPAGTTDDAQLRAAITATIRQYGGVRGCAAVMATEYGEHPTQAVERMRWARDASQLLAWHQPKARNGR